MRFSRSSVGQRATCSAEYVQWTHLCSGQRPAWPRRPDDGTRRAVARTRCRRSDRHFRTPARTVRPWGTKTGRRSVLRRSPSSGHPSNTPARYRKLIWAVRYRLRERERIRSRRAESRRAAETAWSVCDIPRPTRFSLVKIRSGLSKTFEQRSKCLIKIKSQSWNASTLCKIAAARDVCRAESEK